MKRKNLKTEDESLVHKENPVETPVKLLEVTPENLNAVLLELKKDESLLKINFKNIVNFIFKTCDDNFQILAKLKILCPRENEEEDVVDSIFRIIVKILGYKVGDGLEKVVVTVSGEIYPFSRRLCLWYFKNKQLEDKEVEFYLEEIERIVFKTGRINFITEECEEDSEEEFNEGDCDEEVSGDEQIERIEEINNEQIERIEEINNEHTNNEHIIDTNKIHTIHCVTEVKDKQQETPSPNGILGDLQFLTDSEEIERLDKALGIVFKDKHQVCLSVSDKKRIAKCLDVLEIILENNSIDKLIHFKRLLGLVDIDDVLFKKVFRVLKLLTKKYPDEHLGSLYAFYVDALFKYKNIARTIDTMQEYFKGMFRWEDVFKASSKNELLDLNIVDRSKINKEEFYAYCFTEQVLFWRIQGLILYFTRREENVKILEAFRDLVNRIEFSDEKAGVIESINNRIKTVGGA